MNSRRRLLKSGPLAAAVLAAVAATCSLPSRAGDDTAAVVVELFTSQGCSSCPPADAVLAGLVDDSDVIALAYHVDYWDRLGWKDRYASPAFSARQYRYAEWLRGQAYTPQIIVDGRAAMVGSKQRAVRAALASARNERRVQKLPLHRDGDALRIDASTLAAADKADEVLLLSVRPFATTKITAGENAGEELPYRVIVSSMRRLGKPKPALKTSLRGVERELPLVVLIQNRKSGRIKAAGRLDREEAPAPP